MAVVLEALRRPPCIVTFSGGRDSSVVLALAARVADEHGLPGPVPVTLRFPNDPESEESEWQELVVRHLGITEWLRLEFTDELDFVGPVAAATLRRHGLLWPPNAHFHVPGFERARGGAVLSGAFGDEIFTEDPGRVRVRQTLYRRRVPSRRDILRIGLALAPRPVRRAVIRRRLGYEPAPPWIGEQLLSEVRDRLASQRAAAPIRWDSSVRTFLRLRYAEAGVRALSILAGEYECVVRAPLGDPRFLASLATSIGRVGFSDRTQAMRALFSDLLPDEVLARSSKGAFRAAFWNRHVRRFAEQWSPGDAGGGGGFDPGYAAGFAAGVDAGVLRDVWLRATDVDSHLPEFAIQSATALQAAWLAADVAQNGPTP